MTEGTAAAGRPLTTPVAFLLFNRPDTTARVFEAIRAARPPRLLLVADGPRPDRPGEAERCQETRAVASRVDWPCRVETCFSDVNLGCRRRIASGLDWVFAQVEEAIVLEDDCLPHPTFFRYCEELLARHRDDPRVMTISGTSYHFGRRFSADSYLGSRYPHVWGWASWRRAWAAYDVTLAAWPALKASPRWRAMHPRSLVRRHWERMFDETLAGTNDTWDYQLAFACQLHGGLSLTPAVNLVENVGFGGGATKTTRRNRFAEMPVEPMAFPLRHPDPLGPCLAADRATEDAQYLVHSAATRLLRAWWKAGRTVRGALGHGLARPARGDAP
jgi:hypothetical protein